MYINYHDITPAGTDQQYVPSFFQVFPSTFIEL